VVIAVRGTIVFLLKSRTDGGAASPPLYSADDDDDSEVDAVRER